MKLLALASSFLLAGAFTGALSVERQQPAMPGKEDNSRMRLSPAEIELYKRAKTLIDWTPRQIADSPYLRKLRPPASEDQLSMVLERVGQTSTLLFHDFPQVACDEDVFSEAKGIPYSWQRRKFRYIVIPKQTSDFPRFEEYRTDLKGTPLDAASLGNFFMITANFVSTGLYLSTAEQPDCHFRYFGTQAIRNRQCHVVGFAQNPEKARSVELFSVQCKTVVLLSQGLVWIDSESFQILRVITWLLASREDIGLSSATSTVDFFPVRPRGSEKVFWLPCDVKVVSVFRGVKIHNTHHYSNFKLFRVESTIKAAP